MSKGKPPREHERIGVGCRRYRLVDQAVDDVQRESPQPMIDGAIAVSFSFICRPPTIIVILVRRPRQSSALQCFMVDGPSQPFFRRFEENIAPESTSDFL